MRSLVMAGGMIAAIASACGGTTVGTTTPSVGVGATASPMGSPAAVVPASPSPTTVSPSRAPMPPGQLVFQRLDGGPEGTSVGTFVASSDGSDEHEVTFPASGVLGGGKWSPDGSRLLVNPWTLPDGPGRVGTIRPDGSGFQAVGSQINVDCGAWSPDASTVLCDTNDLSNPKAGVFTMRTDGTHLVHLTVSPYKDTVGTAGECGGGDSRGVMSPDGLRYAFIRQKCGTGPDPSSDETGAILVGNLAGGDPTTIVPLGGVLTHPGSQLSWSPDGQWIAFGTPDGRLQAVHPDGTGLHAMTPGPPMTTLFKLGPTWSPDGTRLAFTAQDGSLWVMAADGSDLRDITGTTPGEYFVDWGVAP